MKLEEYTDRGEMMRHLADHLADELSKHLLDHDHASFAVPGGSTPGPIFDALSAKDDLDWARIHVMLTDERWVPESSDRSNTALVKRRLLTGPGAAASFVPFYTGHGTPEEGLPGLAAHLAPALPISVLLLGMGADLHTASLFPGADQLTAALAPDAPPVMAMRAPGAPEPRITLTAPVLDGALSTHVLITGAEKRTALEGIASKSVEEAPVKLVLADATVHWAP